MNPAPLLDLTRRPGNGVDRTPRSYGPLGRVAVVLDPLAPNNPRVLGGNVSGVTLTRGKPVDPRTGYPFRAIPELERGPRDLDDAVTRYFRVALTVVNPATSLGAWASLTDAQRAARNTRVEAIGAILRAWGWTSTEGA